MEPSQWSQVFSLSYFLFVIANFSIFSGRYCETLADARAALQLRPNYIKAIERGMIEIVENS